MTTKEIRSDSAFLEFRSGFKRYRMFDPKHKRRFRGMTLIINRKEGDLYGWTIRSDDGKPEFSDETFETYERALLGLWQRVNRS